MSENIFLFIGFGIFLVFMWMLWLRNNLMTDFRAASEKLSLLNHDHEKRANLLPYLLESYKNTNQPTDLWRKLVEDRAIFHTDKNVQLDFENHITQFINESESVKNINFLEAKKEILEINTHINKEKIDAENAIQVFNSKHKKFPYSLASAIFSFRDLAL